jgi:hypothetical protein
MTNATSDKNLSQSDKFKEAAGEHGADEDEARWEERLKKVAGRAKQPGPAKEVGDASPNPLPDNPADNGSGSGGDPGRSS